MSSDSRDLVVGDRVEVEGCRATVRYVGEVDGFGAQQWVGVEWDDEERGKHDGIVKGKRYFTTRAPKGGSLVKIGNVTRPKSLLDEIRNRYDDTYDDEEIVLKNTTKVVELVGMQKTASKQSNIYRLINIVLDNRLVGFAPSQTSTEHFTSCKELNLYANLLHRWSDVCDILTFFPNLLELNLRRNRMDDFVEEIANSVENVDRVYSTSVKKLVVSECGLTETSVAPVLERFPRATEIVSFGNNLTIFDVGQAASRITALDLEENPLKKISTIRGEFPNLKSLNVINCGISSLEDFDGGRFPKLESLNLKRNTICDWSSVNKLQSSTSLRILQFDVKNLEAENGIPVHEVVIAKLSQISELNRFEISEVERRSAEIRFLNKYVLVKDETKKKPHAEDLKRLIQIHGEPSTDTARKGLSVLKLTIFCDKVTVERSLPLTMSVQKISDMLSRMFGVAGSVQLYLQCDDGEKKHRVELDNPLRTLGHYSPQENDVLVVEKK